MKYVNEEEKFWKHSFNVWLSAIGKPICVNADHEQDALDYAVDYAEEQGWSGLFVDEEDIKHDSHENEIDIIRAGNHSLALPAEEVHIKQID